MKKENWKTKTLKGFKFLDPLGATYYSNEPFYYLLPRPDQKWGDWQTHPDPATKPDGDDCGSGAFHVMKRIDASYAPDNWWVWFAEGRGIVGESNEKFRCIEIRLRRIPVHVLWRIARLGHLTGANLRGADLRGADLREADLRGANLRGADLREANLWGANLWGANLWGANLWGANLRGAINWEYALRGNEIRKLFEEQNK